MMRRSDVWPLGAIGFILLVSAAWWAFALAPVGGAPEWYARARAVCFNLTETGLPDAKGWLLLLGQPPTMLALLWVGWTEELRGSLSRLVSRRDGRVVVSVGVSLVGIGLALAASRVAQATPPSETFAIDEAAPDTYPRLDRTFPLTTGLVSQNGPFSSEAIQASVALVTFAFGHCETICPVVVHQSREVRRRLGSEQPDWAAAAIVVFTLDPWRDTPSRLGSLVQQFDLDPDRDFVVSGSVPDVNAALDAWGIPRSRDEATGDVGHPSLVYLVERDGTIAYASSGGVEQLTSLAVRLGREATIP